MNRVTLAFVAIIFILQSCSQNDSKNEVIDAETTITEVTESTPEHYLMHDVFLDLKDSITENEIAFAIEQLKRLEQLETVHWVHVGKRAETGDARLDSKYDLALHVVFKSLDDLHVYDKDLTHADVRAQLKDLLAGPPVVFDYWTE